MESITTTIELLAVGLPQVLSLAGLAVNAVPRTVIFSGLAEVQFPIYSRTGTVT
jgi:hypothetical protein